MSYPRSDRANTPDEEGPVSRLGEVVERARWLRTGWRRPVAWVPLTALVVLTGVLAELVEPWPEGPVLLTLTGTGPHGITLSDIVVLVVVGVLSVVWLWAISSPPQTDVGEALGTFEGRRN